MRPTTLRLPKLATLVAVLLLPLAGAGPGSGALGVPYASGGYYAECQPMPGTPDDPCEAFVAQDLATGEFTLHMASGPVAQPNPYGPGSYAYAAGQLTFVAEHTLKTPVAGIAYEALLDIESAVAAAQMQEGLGYGQVDAYLRVHGGCDCFFEVHHVIVSTLSGPHARQGPLRLHLEVGPMPATTLQAEVMLFAIAPIYADCPEECPDAPLAEGEALAAMEGTLSRIRFTTG